MDNIKLDFQKHIDAGRCNGAEWIINHKNNIYHEVIGYKDLELKNKLNKNSYYRIWSMTKPIIGFVAMQLIEKNFLSLDDTIDKHLSNFKIFTFNRSHFLDGRAFIFAKDICLPCLLYTSPSPRDS